MGASWDLAASPRGSCGPSTAARAVRWSRWPVASVDQYHAEVDNLTAAILDGTPPRIGLAFSRGNIATLVELDQTARVNAGLIGG